MESEKEYATEIRQLIQLIAGTYNSDEQSHELCTVNAVYLTGENQWTCDVTPLSGVNTTKITGVFLTALPASNGLILVPAVGSTVVVLITTRNGSFVKFTSEVDQLIFYRDNGNNTFQTFIINSTIQLGDGSFGGLVEGGNLTTKLNNLVNQIQTQLGLISAAIGALGGSYTPGTLNTFTASDYENTNVTHGT